MIKNEKKYIAYAFFLNLILGILLVYIGFAMGEGTFYQGPDYNYQQIPFNALARKSVLSGNFWWLDNFELGTSFIGALSFYVIGSPFFWISFLIPNPNYSVVIPCMLALKFAVAGTGAYCYIKQYVKKPEWALIASMLYAFSGYQLTNINYNHFHDVTALFPFLLLALDKNVKDDKKGWFAFMVAVMCLTSYFFFVGVVVFLVIYFAVKLATKEYRLTTKLFIRLAIESILGVGMAMILLLPNIFFVLENPRVSDSIFSMPIMQILFLKPYQYADLLRASLIPAESIFKRGIILEMNPTASEMYLPVVGLIPTFSYMINHKKDWLTKLSFVCLVFMINPVLNSSFSMFNSEYYTRWFYMPLLIFTVMAAKHFENKDSIKPGMVVWFVVVLLFFGASLMWKYYFQVEFWPNRLQAFVMIVLALVGVGTTMLVYALRNKKFAGVLLVIAIMVQTVACFTIDTYYTHKYWDSGYDSARKFFNDVPGVLYPDADEYYRTETKDIFINTGVVSDKPSANIFASNISGSVFEFYKANEMARSVNSFLSRDFYGFYSLLGVKYMMLPQGAVPGENTKGFSDKAVWSDTGFDFYENINYIGMGFAYDNAISADEYAKLPKEKKHLVSVDAIVLEDDTMSLYNNLFTIKTAKDYSGFEYGDFQLSAQNKQSSRASNFLFDRNHYEFDINLEKETVYYVAVPYDKGFTAMVNGTKTNVIKVNNGMVGIVLPAGECSVQLTYFPQGLKAGIAVSALSLFMYFGYIILNRRKKNG